MSQSRPRHGQDSPSQTAPCQAKAGGRTLATPFAFAVLSPRFPAPDGIQEGFNGDYTGLVVIGAGNAHPIWSDTRVSVPKPNFDNETVDEDVFTNALQLPA